MKRTIAAILVLSPVLLFAQTNAPAQPSSTPVLQSSLQPIAVAAAKTLASPAPAVAPVRTSTGVLPPKLVYSVDLALPTNSPDAAFLRHSTVVVHMTVDSTGKPTEMALDKSTLPSVDADVLHAVSQFRYKPGTLDGIAVAVPVTLAVVIE